MLHHSRLKGHAHVCTQASVDVKALSNTTTSTARHAYVHIVERLKVCPCMPPPPHTHTHTRTHTLQQVYLMISSRRCPRRNCQNDALPHHAGSCGNVNVSRGPIQRAISPLEVGDQRCHHHWDNYTTQGPQCHPRDRLHQPGHNTSHKKWDDPETCVPTVCHANESTSIVVTRVRRVDVVPGAAARPIWRQSFGIWLARCPHHMALACQSGSNAPTGTLDWPKG